MSFVGSAKERYFYHNTLLCLIKATLNKDITVDLRNDSYIGGTVVAVDGYMNITFANAVYCDPQGNEYEFENLFVQSRNIRYVHIPESMPIISTIKQELVGNKEKKKQKKQEMKNVEQSRKRTKALRQHMETVASLTKQTTD